MQWLYTLALSHACVLLIRSKCTRLPYRAKCSVLQGARTCYFSSVERTEGKLHEAGHHESASNMPASSLFALEGIIQQRVQQHTQDTGKAVPQHLQQSASACAIVSKAQAAGGHTITEQVSAPALCIHYHGFEGCQIAWDVTISFVCNIRKCLVMVC